VPQIRPVPGSPAHWSNRSVGESRSASVQEVWQRHGQAMFGDHTYRDVASLTGLPAAVVAELMRTGLTEAGRERR
jgi:hypothetical protein